MTTTDDFPLNCLSDTGDGFSGWFAISNPRKCTDFCYWSVSSNKDSSKDQSNGDATKDWYNAYNTADPHHTTVITQDNGDGIVYWTCVYDSSGDDVLASSAVGQRWVDTYHQFITKNSVSSGNIDTLKTNNKQNGSASVPFPYLKCQKGSGEELSTWDGELVQSALFWESFIFMCSSLYLVEIIFGMWYYKRRWRRYERIGLTNQEDRVIELDSLQLSETANDVPPTLHEDFIMAQSLQMNGQINAEQHHHQTPRCRICSPITTKLCNTPSSRRKWITLLQILLFVLLNALLAFTIVFSSISLMEIHNSPMFTESMRQWTPACSNPDLVCEKGNHDIDRISLPWNGARQVVSTDDLPTSEMQPFSYLIASDAQLNWFNGEFPQMGSQNLPSSCSPADSCYKCTRKHGYETNLRMKRGWERLMTGDVDGMEQRHNIRTEESYRPVPDTLIMNGDLTAYFHPSEKYVYDSIYKDIKGLKNYFPSLGNHDIEHMSGAKFGGDQWNGPPNCNIEHAIGYFKSGFCGQIPNFNSHRIIRYDSGSLAYSWDEGRYHFVHTHYYPTYEMASMKYQSSSDWLDRDLTLARDAGMFTVLFVHAANYLIRTIERVILGKNVVAIIAGHDHRCLHRRCEGIYPIHEDQVDDGILVDKCIPAAYDTCQVLNGEQLIFVKDINLELVSMPKKKLENKEQTDKPLCPKPAPFYINETDNTLLCRRVRYNKPNYPFEGDGSNETIPIFWSGSSSFETFLRADFYEDRIVINAMSLDEDGSVSRYIDGNSVPNARYPFHETADLDEFVINVP